MRRLWVRLSLAFSFVIVTGVVFIISAGLLISQNRILSDFILARYQAKGGLVDQLSDYYHENQSWEGVESLLERQDAMLPRFPDSALALSFSDVGGNVIYDAVPDKFEDNNNPKERVIALPIVADGWIRGYLHLNRLNLDAVPDDIQPFLFQQIIVILLTLASIVGGIGIVAGIIMSRTLTAPLNHLAQTAREFGTKNLSRRAEIKGSTEIVAVASAFNEMADALEKAELLRRSLVADVAHELRTPLTVLEANLQAMLDGVYPMNTDEIEKLAEQTELLHHLVDDLHELAQAESKQLTLHLSPVDLPELVTNTVLKFNAIAVAQEILLKLEMQSEPLMVTADANRLQQVINNLVQNALTHTPAGGAVTVSLRQDEKFARIVVQDTGNGISAEHLPHIFERFYRADRSRSRQTGGTGLGLTIAKALVEMHGGQVLAASDAIPGHGAAFSILLPL